MIKNTLIKYTFYNNLILLIIGCFFGMSNANGASSNMLAYPNCLVPSLTFTNSASKSGTSIVAQLQVKNSCTSSVDLTQHKLLFTSLSGTMPVMLNPFIYPATNPTAAVFTAFSNPSANDGVIIGTFTNYAPLNGSIILNPAQTFTATSTTFYPYDISYNTSTQAYILSPSDTNFTITSPTSFSYGRDSLLHITLGSYGLKTYVITNTSSVFTYSDISFSLTNPFPADITYFSDLTTCKTDGSQVLMPTESCSVVFKYKPIFEGVNYESSPQRMLTISIGHTNSLVPISIASQRQQLMYSSVLIGDSYSTQLGVNPQIGFTLTAPESFPYKRDSLEGISLGSFGLKTYIITNNSPNNVYGVTLPTLTGEFSYYLGSTCRLDNKQIFLPGQQSCTIVIKYKPTKSKERSVLPIQVVGIDEYHNIWTNNVINLPYSSN